MTAADDLTAAEVKVSGFARAVAMKRAVIVAAAGGLLMLAASRGWVTPGLSGTVRADLNACLDFLTVVGAGAWIHRVVTPAKQELQPVNSAGQNLVPDPSASNALAELAGNADPAIGAALDDVIAGTMISGSGNHAAGTLTVGGQQPEQPAPFMEGGSVTRAAADGAAAANTALTPDAAPPDASAMGSTDPVPPSTEG